MYHQYTNQPQDKPTHEARAVTLVEMMVKAREGRKLSQKDFAAALDFTPQYVCDLEKGRRLGSVEFVNRLCDWLDVTVSERKKWHLAGARAHGWEL